MVIKQVSVILHKFRHPGFKYKFLRKLGDGVLVKYIVLKIKKLKR